MICWFKREWKDLFDSSQEIPIDKEITKLFRLLNIKKGFV